MPTTIVRPSDRTTDRFEVCLVVDVVRATTTAAILCERLRELWIAPTPVDLRDLPPRERGYALFSEIARLETGLMRYDNSPVQARDADLDGKAAVLVTTNGTRAAAIAAQRADEVVLASFANLTAAVEHALRRDRVAIMPAGSVGTDRRNAEDEACAHALHAALTGAPFDVPTAIAACHADKRIRARVAREPNLVADLELCFAVDSAPVVPRIAGTRASCFHVTA